MDDGAGEVAEGVEEAHGAGGRGTGGVVAEGHRQRGHPTPAARNRKERRRDANQ